MKHSEYIENKQRGSRDFPIQLYRVNEDHPDYVMRLHWQRELEIIRVTSGRFELYVNNTPYILLPGDIAFVNCNTLHRGEPFECQYECIVVDLSILVRKGNYIFSSFIDPIISGDLIIQTIKHFDNSMLCATVNSLFRLLADQKKYYELAVMGMLFELFEQLYSSQMILENKQSKKGAGQTAAIGELIKWIEDNYTEHITLSMLADKVGMTPNYLCRIFKEYTGKSPIEYVNFIRIDSVCFDISQGQKNITTAAINNGYNDLSYFCKVFKKLKGVSAKAYSNRFN